MTHDEQNPIEPLPDSAWNRIESAVFEELDDRARSSASHARRAFMPRWAVAALAAVVVLQAAAVVLFVLRRSDAPKPLASTRFVAEREASDAMLGDVSVHLDPASALTVVENAAQGSLCVLERGAARFSVPHRGARPAFLVQAGEVRVEVVGTRFRVERSGESARVDAYEGTVRVVAQGEARLLTRGQHWSPNASASAPAAALAPPGRSVATLPDPQLEPAAQAASAALRSQPSTRASDTAHPDRQQTRFEQATALEASDPDAALRIYRGLAHENGRWAENALYARARLELDLGHRSAARGLLHSYLDRHPAGANAADARSLLRRLTRETGKTDP